MWRCVALYIFRGGVRGGTTAAQSTILLQARATRLKEDTHVRKKERPGRAEPPRDRRRGLLSDPREKFKVVQCRRSPRGDVCWWRIAGWCCMACVAIRGMLGRWGSSGGDGGQDASDDSIQDATPRFLCSNRHFGPSEIGPVEVLGVLTSSSSRYASPTATTDASTNQANRCALAEVPGGGVTTCTYGPAATGA